MANEKNLTALDLAIEDLQGQNSDLLAIRQSHHTRLSGLSRSFLTIAIAGFGFHLSDWGQGSESNVSVAIWLIILGYMLAAMVSVSGIVSVNYTIGISPKGVWNELIDGKGKDLSEADTKTRIYLGLVRVSDHRAKANRTTSQRINASLIIATGSTLFTVIFLSPIGSLIIPA